MNFSNLAAWWANISTTELIWLTVGFAAQAMFSMRFIMQWLASEKRAPQRRAGDFLVFQLRGRLDAVHLRDLSHGPGFHPRPGLRSFHLCPQYPFHHTRASAKSPAIVKPGYKPAGE